MDNRPIGVFDSGFGGLMTVRALLERFPAESILFFGDNSRAPYGTHGAAEVRRMTLQNINFLLHHNVKAIIAACCTATSTLPLIDCDFDIPVTGAVEPAVEVAVSVTKSKRIAILSTPLTLEMGLYNKSLQQHLPEASLFTQACPDFVTLVENGHIDKHDPAVKDAVAGYLAEIRTANVDTMILGCTHFPILSAAIQDYMGPAVKLIDPGQQAAYHTMQQLQSAAKQASGDARTEQYYTSGPPEAFVQIGEKIVCRPLSGRVEYLSLEDFPFSEDCGKKTI